MASTAMNNPKSKLMHSTTLQKVEMITSVEWQNKISEEA